MAKAANETAPPDDNIIDLFAPPLRRNGATPAELAEYRRIKPQLLQMLREWQTLKAPGGCPVARNLLAPHD